MNEVIEMHKGDSPQPNQAAPSVAPLRNVQLMGQLIDQLVKRDLRLPGIGVFYGPSGFGKSFAAAYQANKTHAYYVECKSTWSPGAFCDAIARELGIRTAHSIGRRVEDVGEELAAQGRPLIVDEADHLARSTAMIELVRDIYAASEAAVILIGEELLPKKLERWERFHNRVLAWQASQPSGAADITALSAIYAPGVVIADDLNAALIDRTRGVTRRVCVNLVTIAQAAKVKGLEIMDLAAFPIDKISTGRAPTARAGWGAR